MNNKEWDLPPLPRKPLDTTLVAMIDIMFVLLLFFMTTTSFSKAGVAIHPPHSSMSQPSHNDSIDVTVTQDGHLFLGSQPQDTYQNLTDSLGLYSTKKSIRLHTDRQTTSQMMLGVLEACKKAGFESFQIAAVYQK